MFSCVMCKYIDIIWVSDHIQPTICTSSLVRILEFSYNESWYIQYGPASGVFYKYQSMPQTNKIV